VSVGGIERKGDEGRGRGEKREQRGGEEAGVD